MTLVHGHRVVNGHSGYVTPLAVWLGGGLSPLREAERQSDAVALLRGIGVRYLVVHRSAYEDRSLADGITAVIEGEPRQIAAHRTFGDTTVALLTPLDLPAAPAQTQMIPFASIRAQSSHSADRLPLLFDNDPDSRWLTGAHQSGDEWLQLDLNRIRDVGVIRLHAGARSSATTLGTSRSTRSRTRVRGHSFAARCCRSWPASRDRECRVTVDRDCAAVEPRALAPACDNSGATPDSCKSTELRAARTT